MRTILTTAAVVLTLSFTSATLAQCSGHKGKEIKAAEGKRQCDKTAKKGCCPSKAAKLASGERGKSSCDSTKMASCGSDKSCTATACTTPKMKFMVAGEKLCCPRNAEILAEAHETDVKYWVSGKEYCERGEAMAAYQNALEQHLSGMTQVRYMVAGECVPCPMTAKQMAKKNGGHVKYCVAGRQFDCKDKATHAASAAEKAVENVSWTVNVDGKDYKCAKKAAAMSKKCGSKCEYKIGDKSTCCKQTAEVELTKARIEAAREAINSTETETETASGDATETAGL